MSDLPQSAAVAATFLAAFALFLPALLVQFRGTDWVPRWLPADLRRRSSTAIGRVAALLGAGFWTIGGQGVVLYLTQLRLSQGRTLAGIVFLAELVGAALIATAWVRASMSDESGDPPP